MSSNDVKLDPNDEKNASDLGYSPHSLSNPDVPDPQVLEAGDAPLGVVTGSSTSETETESQAYESGCPFSQDE